MNSNPASLVLTRPQRVPRRLSLWAERITGPAARDGCVRWDELFGQPPLPGADCQALDQLVSLRTVRAGEAVFTRSEPASHLVALLDGHVALGQIQYDATMRTERLVQKTAWLDLSSAWLNGCHALDAQALTLARVADVACEPLLALLDTRPLLARRLIVSLALEVHQLTAINHDLIHKDAPARLASWLCKRAVPWNGTSNQGVVHLVERKRDIASQLGMTPETLSRLMRSLSDQGVIAVDGYTVTVRALSALRTLAGS